MKEWYTIPSHLSTSAGTHFSSSSTSLVNSSDNKHCVVSVHTSISSDSPFNSSFKPKAKPEHEPQSITIICEDCKPNDFTFPINQLVADILKIILQRAELDERANDYCLVLSNYLNVPLPITRSLSDLHITENTHFKRKQ